MDSPISIDLPVRATLIAPNTPGSRVPSHGTTMYGEMYAIDFVVIDPKTLSLKPYRSSLLKYLVMGLPLKDFYGWGQEVYAPASGVVVEAVDGIPERNPVNVFLDLRNTLSVTRDFTTAKGLPFTIRSYATYTQGKWACVRDGLPRKDEIFRPV